MENLVDFAAVTEVMAERDALAAAVERVRALHQPYGPDVCGPANGFCHACQLESPCPTLRALDGGAS